MNTPQRTWPLFRIKALIAGIVFLLSSCGEKKDNSTAEGGTGEQATITPLKNQLGTGPTDYTRRFQDSKISWQNWNDDVFAEAKKQEKPVMVLISSGRYTESFDVLKDLEESSELREKLEENFISCFADTHAYPELATLAYNLSVTNGSFSFPFIIWFSPDGDPLAWHPLLRSSGKSAALVLSSMANSVKDTWTRDPAYSLKHSKKTNDKIIERYTPLVIEEPEEATSQGQTYGQIMRGLLALYDPIDNSVDGIGSLIPYGLLESLDNYHYFSDKDSALDRRAQELIKKVTPSYLITPLKDPLDKGFFYAKFGKGWDFPNFSKTLESQASLISLLSNPRIAQSIPPAQKYVEDATTYISESLTNADQTVSSYEVVEGIVESQNYNLWTVKELDAILSAPEFKAVKYMSNLKERGNISSTSDPLKKNYRQNTLAELHPRSTAANALGVSVAQMSQTLDSAWEKIGAAREKRAVEMNYRVFKETTASVNQQANAAYAYLVAYKTSQDPKHIAKAKVLLALIQKYFWTEESGLQRIVARDSGSESIRARGMDYNLVIRAYLLAHEVTLGADHLAFAQTLNEEAYDRLADDNGFHSEVAEGDLPCRGVIYSYVMLFGDSTLGTLPMLSAQLGELTKNEKLITSGKNSFLLVERGMKQLALVHSDLLRKYPVPLGKVIVLTGDPENQRTHELKRVLLHPQFKNYQFIHYSEGSTAKLALDISKLNEPAIHVFEKGEKVGLAQSSQQLLQLLKVN